MLLGKIVEVSKDCFGKSNIFLFTDCRFRLSILLFFFTYACLNWAVNRKIKEEGSEAGEEESKTEAGM